jgi:hypothetical protein
MAALSSVNADISVAAGLRHAPAVVVDRSLVRCNSSVKRTNSLGYLKHASVHFVSTSTCKHVGFSGVQIGFSVK